MSTTRWSAPKNLACALVGLAACTTAARPDPKKPAIPAPVASATPVAVADASAPPVAIPDIPELTPELFQVADKGFDAVYAINGATVVTRENVAGYIDGDRVEWIAKIPKDTNGLGSNGIYDVRGSYPNSVDAIYQKYGRASMETYVPLTGKGNKVEACPEGCSATLLPAYVGDTLLIATWSNFRDVSFTTARGKPLVRKFQPDSKCFPSEPVRSTDTTTDKSTIDMPWSPNALIVPSMLETTDDGAIVSIGEHCRRGGTAWAEIWDPGQSTSRVVDLKSFGDPITELVRFDNEIWALRSNFADPLVFRNGNFVPGPHLDSPIRRLFVSPSHQLHAFTEDGTIHRWVDRAFQPVAHIKLTDDDRLYQLVADPNGNYWATIHHEKSTPWTQVYRLRETGKVPAAVACKSWVVKLNINTGNQPPNWQYPATQKALSGYPEAESLKIIEYGPSNYYHALAVSVRDRAQGEAVAPFLKEYSPHVVCYSLPRIARTIDVKK